MYTCEIDFGHLLKSLRGVKRKPRQFLPSRGRWWWSVEFRHWCWINYRIYGRREAADFSRGRDYARDLGRWLLELARPRKDEAKKRRKETHATRKNIKTDLTYTYKYAHEWIFSSTRLYLFRNSSQFHSRHANTVFSSRDRDLGLRFSSRWHAKRSLRGPGSRVSEGKPLLTKSTTSLSTHLSLLSSSLEKTSGRSRHVVHVLGSTCIFHMYHARSLSRGYSTRRSAARQLSRLKRPGPGSRDDDRARSTFSSQILAPRSPRGATDAYACYLPVLSATEKIGFEGGRGRYRAHAYDRVWSRCACTRGDIFTTE